jgi:DNA repair protein RecO (recombination protein O)
MKTTVTRGIVLSRINYQEADRILIVLTPDQGKVRLIAKGVRKVKSKLAGGVELLSENEISFIRGRGEVGTLVSSRLKKHYPNIIKDIDRTMYAYELLKTINKLTEDNADEEYYLLVKSFLSELDNLETNILLIKLWADIKLLEAYGYEPELGIDTGGVKLSKTLKYDFDFENTAFSMRDRGIFDSGHIQLMRLALNNRPDKIGVVNGVEKLLVPTQRLTESIRKQQLNV